MTEESIKIDTWKLEANTMILLIRQEVKNPEIQAIMIEFVEDAKARVLAD